MAAVTSRRLLLTIVLLLSCSASAQTLRVVVSYANDHAFTAHARVQLMGSASNNALEEDFTNDRGEISFINVGGGDYHVVVTGEGIQDADSGIFEMEGRVGTQTVTVTVQRIGEGASRGKPGAPSVSAKQLKVPRDAKGKLDDATQLMAKSDWAGASDRLNQAIKIYPDYAEAYNNLAAAQSRLGNRSGAREALLKAISVDDHFAPAYVNLAHMEEGDQKFEAAEDLYAKAITIDPSNVETLTLLCRTQLLDKHYDAAIETARRVHAMPHASFATVHYIAARAYQRENRAPDAIAEFKTLLQEEPTGARSDAIRKELAEMEGKAR